MSSSIKATYPIFFGDESVSEWSNWLRSTAHSSVFILNDSNTHVHCLQHLLNRLPELSLAPVLTVPAGERHKNLESVASIIRFLMEKDADRNALLLNLGGGMIGDLGGFAASVYKRGINFIHVPTSLLAMADASIGGKNGVDFLDAKNMVGTFTNPSAVFIAPAFLDTLPAREKRAGYAEIIKHAVCAGGKEWKQVEATDIRSISHKDFLELLKNTIRYKLSIVASDPLDRGERMILNFGHTIGHALESVFLKKDELLHGEAVAAGMAGELFLSHKLAGLPGDAMDSAIRYIRSVFHDLDIACPVEELIRFMKSDKKNRDGRIGFCLPSGSGETRLIFPDPHQIREAVDFMFQTFSAKLYHDQG